MFLRSFKNPQGSVIVLNTPIQGSDIDLNILNTPSWSSDIDLNILIPPANPVEYLILAGLSA